MCAVLAASPQAGCTLVEGPEVIGRGSIASDAHYSLSSSFEGQNRAEKAAVAAVQQVLANRGFRVGNDAGLLLEVGLASREVDIGIAAAPADQSSQRDVVWSSRPQAQALVDFCQQATFRLTVVLFERRTGKIAYRGSADDQRCASKLDKSLDRLAMAALANLKMAGS